MDRFVIMLLFSVTLLLPTLLCGQGGSFSNEAFQSRLAAIKSKSQKHEGRVRDLLAQPALKGTNFDIPAAPKWNEVESLPSVDAEPSFIPVPEYYDAEEIEEVKEVSRPPSAEDLVVDPNLPTTSEPEEPSEDLDEAYSALYDSKVPERHLGYYFGALLGFSIPEDGALRDQVAANKEPYESDLGFLMGLHLGKDFGSSRVEAEYNYLNFDGSGGVEVSSHNMMLRLMLEHEVGDRFDLRTGLGMGIGFLNFEHGQDYGGTSFAYDFMVGMGYRVAENWSLQVDYRYFLTAANDEYDRLKSHMILLSADFDL